MKQCGSVLDINWELSNPPVEIMLFSLWKKLGAGVCRRSCLGCPAVWSLLCHCWAQASDWLHCCQGCLVVSWHVYSAEATDGG